VIDEAGNTNDHIRLSAIDRFVFVVANSFLLSKCVVDERSSSYVLFSDREKQLKLFYEQKAAQLLSQISIADTRALDLQVRSSNECYRKQ
jgi:hypothetical protein